MTKELSRRIVVTIGARLTGRLGSHVPVAVLWTAGGLVSSGGLACSSISC